MPCQGKKTRKRQIYRIVDILSGLGQYGNNNFNCDGSQRTSANWNFAPVQVHGAIESSFSFAFNPNTDSGLISMTDRNSATAFSLFPSSR